MRRPLLIARFAALLLSLLLPLFATAGARAEIFSACSVLPTPDGYVALRDSPSPSGRLLARMHPDEIVVIDVKGHDFVRSDGWLRVSHYPGPAFPARGAPEFAKVRRGWAKDRLVGECG